MTNRKKIILAEDNPADVELTKIAIEETGLPIDLVHVFDGQELVNLIDQTELEEIALILLDLNMPKMGGIDVLKHLSQHEEQKKIPVIVFSSSTHESDVLTCYDYGANAYVCKPIDLNSYTKTMSAITSFWIEANVMPLYE